MLRSAELGRSPSSWSLAKDPSKRSITVTLIVEAGVECRRYQGILRSKNSVGHPDRSLPSNELSQGGSEATLFANAAGNVKIDKTRPRFEEDAENRT